MDTNSILEHMTESGIGSNTCQILQPIIDDLGKTKIDPYMIAVDLVHTASCIVTKTLPPDELFHFGKFLNECADTNIRGAMTKRVINTNGSNQNYTPAN